MNQYYSLPNILTIYIVIFAAFIQRLEEATNFNLPFEMVLQGHITLNQ